MEPSPGRLRQQAASRRIPSAGEVARPNFLAAEMRSGPAECWPQGAIGCHLSAIAAANGLVMM